MSDQPAMSEQDPGVFERMKQAVGMGSTDESPAATVPEQPPIQFRRVQIIVNPASGQTGLNLPALNKVLQDLEIEWDMAVLRKGGEARERAKQAVEAKVDAVVVYGGDGTVLEVADGLIGSGIPMIIIPGGTANVLTVELGIPSDQTEAALLLGGSPNAVLDLDMGSLIGGGKDGSDLPFFHLGMGLEGAMHESADRSAKDQGGMLAYAVAALRSLSNPTITHYHLTLDGQEVDEDGINCMVTNFGSVGISGITLSHTIDVSDGLLDVIIFKDANLSTMLTAAAGAMTTGEVAQPLPQWQAREVTISADPPQPIVVDGELLDVKSITVRVLPKVVRVVVPASSAS